MHVFEYMIKTLKYILSIFILFKISLALGGDDHQQSITESYLSRPDVLVQKSVNHEDLPKDWQDFKKGLLEAAAFFIEMYPNHEIYFLARDSEYLYDLVKLMHAGDHARFHLLNISRKNMNDPHILDYLVQNGINSESNKRILLVDTAFIGQIIDHVKSIVPSDVSAKIDGHLLVSAGNYLDLNIFYNEIQPTIGENSISKELSIKRYEHLPHYFERSTFFQNNEGIWHPMSRVMPEGDREADGKVSKILAQKFQEDLSFYSKLKSNKDQFQKRIHQWLKIRNLLDGNRKELVEYVRSLRERENKYYFKSLVLDMIAKAERENPFRFENPLRPAEFNIPSEVSNESGASNRFFMQRWRPDWDKYYLDPNSSLSELFSKKNINLLGQLIEYIESYSFFSTFMSLLTNYDEENTKKSLIRKAILRQSSDLNYFIESVFFANPKNKLIYSEEYSLMQQLGNESLLELKDFVVDGKGNACKQIFKRK